MSTTTTHPAPTGPDTTPPAGPSPRPARRRRRPPAPLDDFAEFLTESYQDYVDACRDAGWVARFDFTPAGHALVIHDLLAGPVEVTNNNRPLPDSPGDLEEWLMTSHVGRVALSPDCSVEAWASAVAGLLAAGR